ncbi:replication initiator protein A [Staphylococcus shinii]|uniref:replication initiator protein A n=1 Tax=Staphylococcus shinii TaxID=2912228 RepID=UPI003F56559B
MENKLETKICHERDKKNLPFIKLYQFLFFEESYANLSYQDKLMYTQMANKQIRILKSDLRNNFLDEDSKPYIKYTIKDLQTELGLSDSTVKRCKRNLVKAGLITTRKNGKMIYINQPTITNAAMTYDNGKKLSYFHMPKFLFDNDIYNSLSVLAKLLYTVLKNRFTYTLTTVRSKDESKYKDNKGRIFCVFTNSELAKMFNVCEETIIQAKKDLMVLGLLKQKPIGKDKPNRLYLYTPLRHEELTIEEVQKEEAAQSQRSKFVLTPPEKSIGVHTWGKAEVKNSSDKGSNIEANNTGFSNTANNNTSINDMYDVYKERVADHSQQTNQSLENDKKDILLNSFSTTLASYLKNFVNKDIKTILGILCNTKNEFNNNYSTDYTLEEIDYKLVTMLKRVREKISKTNETVQQATGLIKVSTINEFKQYDIDLAKEKAQAFAEDEETEGINFAEQLKINAIKALSKKNDFKAIHDKSDFAEDVLDELGIG